MLEGATKGENIKFVVKLKKRILPNSLLFGQQKSLLSVVDPRQQQRSRPLPPRETEESPSRVPAEYRFKEMRLNHFGFYDIDYATFNPWAFHCWMMPERRSWGWKTTFRTVF